MSRRWSAPLPGYCVPALCTFDTAWLYDFKSQFTVQYTNPFPFVPGQHLCSMYVRQIGHFVWCLTMSAWLWLVCCSNMPKVNLLLIGHLLRAATNVWRKFNSRSLCNNPPRSEHCLQYASHLQGKARHLSESICVVSWSCYCIQSKIVVCMAVLWGQFNANLLNEPQATYNNGVRRWK